jgi:hypothetical protein
VGWWELVGWWVEKNKIPILKNLEKKINSNFLEKILRRRGGDKDTTHTGQKKISKKRGSGRTTRTYDESNP